MADMNSSLPVSGVSMPAWTGIGSALITNVIPISGIGLGIAGSVAITSSVGLTQTGSVAITSSALLPISGVNLAGSFAITSSVALTQTGSVAITSSALIPVSGMGIAGGASGTNADFTWHPLRTGSAAAGVPALLLTEVLGSVAVTSANFTGSVAVTSGFLTGSVNVVTPVIQTGSVALTSSVALVVTGSVAISPYVAWDGIGSVLVSNTVNFTPAWEAGSRIYNTSASIAAGGSAVWFYSPAANADIHRIKFSASGRVKAIFGVGSPALTTSEVAFSSTADPNVSMEVSQQVAASSFVQLVCVNNEGAAMDLYSTIYCTF